MIAAIFAEREAYIERLYRLLPGVYRARDTQGDLRAFLGLFADELLRVRANLDQQLKDHFVDSCQDWVLPYLADLVGTDVLSTDGAQNRVDVMNTLRWRRAKGTLAGLEDLAHGVGGMGAHAVEMLTRAVWVQNLAHLRLNARCFLNLRDRDAVAALNSPFSKAALTQDVRPLALRGFAAVGIARTRNVAMHVWPIPSFPVRSVTPRAVGGGRFRFSPLDIDQALYAGGDAEAVRETAPNADIAAEHVEHIPIRTHDARRHAVAYVNSDVGFTIREDGVPLCAPQASTGAVAAPSLTLASEFTDLAHSRGLLPGDRSLFGVAQHFTVEAMRLGTVLQTINGQVSPITYSAGVAFANQLQLLNPHGALQLDGATPDFSYTPGVTPYSPDSGEFHHPALLLRITNQGAIAATFPESEVIVRNDRGVALQVFLRQVTAMAAGATLYLYVADDGSTYYARGDHAFGAPDRNPDQGPFGALALNHLARAAEAQVRLTPGHPVGATRTRRAVLRSLCCWDRPLAPPLASGEVAIDPERGRFAFPAGEMPQGALTVDYRYALSAEVGAGPFDRGTLPSATLTVARDRDADHDTIQAAINAAPDGAATPIVIEILDSATYNEALTIANRSFPGGLTIQASALQTPTIVKPAGPATALRVQNSSIASLVFDGLTFAGGVWQLLGAIDAVSLRFCTLEPPSVSVSMVAAATSFTVESCICGPLDITATGAIAISDSIVQHPAATIEQPQGQAALNAATMALRIERSTLIGDIAGTSAFVSNALLYGAVTVSDLAASCWRFSRLPASLHPPRAFRTTSATPIFLSIEHGHAGYCHLHPNTAAALRTGAEEGGEIGAFYLAGNAWRMQNLARRLGEYTPAAATAFVIPALPRLAFRGNLPI